MLRTDQLQFSCQCQIEIRRFRMYRILMK